MFSYRNTLRGFPNRQASPGEFLVDNWSMKCCWLIPSLSAAPPGRAVPICYKLQVFRLLRANGVELLKTLNTLKYRSQPSEGGEGRLGAQPFVCFHTGKSLALPGLHSLRLKNAAGWRSRECTGGKRRQAIGALRFNYFIKFSQTLQLWTWWIFKTFGKNRSTPVSQ